jgi:hypothetical protein
MAGCSGAATPVTPSNKTVGKPPTICAKAFVVSGVAGLFYEHDKEPLLETCDKLDTQKVESMDLLVCVVPKCTAVIGHDLISQIGLQGSKGNMRMAILATVGPKEDVGTPILVGTGSKRVLAAVVRTAMSHLEVVRIERYISRMICKANKSTSIRILYFVGLACLWRQVDKFKRIRPASLAVRRWVVHGSILFTRVVEADEFQENTGKDPAGVLVKVEPGGNIPTSSLTISPTILRFSRCSTRKIRD